MTNATSKKRERSQDLPTDEWRRVYVSGWNRIKEEVHRERSARYHRQVLCRLSALLGFLFDDRSVDDVDRLEFIHQLRLASFGTSVWVEIERLIYSYCDMFPVCTIWRLQRTLTEIIVSGRMQRGICSLHRRRRP